MSESIFPDYVEEAQAEAKLRFGKELSPQELAANFLGHDFETRIQHLKNLKTPDAMSLNEASKRYQYEAALRRAHEMARKVNR